MTISSPNSIQSHAQNPKGEGSKDSEGIFSTEGGPYSEQIRDDIGVGDDIAGSYQHLIETEYMPTLEKTAYRCKEHPEQWNTSLNDLETSHFKPFH